MSDYGINNEELNIFGCCPSFLAVFDAPGKEEMEKRSVKYLKRLSETDLMEGLTVGYLKKSGFWLIINDYRTSRCINKLFKFYMVVAWILYIPLIYCSIGGILHTTADLKGISLSIMFPVTCIQAIAKFIILWSGIQKNAIFLEIMEKNYLAYVPSVKKKGAFEILNVYCTQSTAIVNLVVKTNVIVYGFWLIVPIWRSEFIRSYLGSSSGGEPITNNKISPLWFPFDYTKSPWTEIDYCFELSVTFLGGGIITLLTCLVVQLVSLITGNIKVLSHLVSELSIDRMKLYYPNKTRQELLTLMKQEALVYVKKHQTLTKLAKDFKLLYDPLVTLQLGAGLIILIVTIFNFFLGSADGDVVEALKFMAHLFLTVLEIILFCHFGNVLETVSEEFGFEAYSSEWCYMDTDFRKMVLLMHMRTSQPTALKVGKVFTVNHMLLRSILQIAYSTSMFLLKVTRGDTKLQV